MGKTLSAILHAVGGSALMGVFEAIEGHAALNPGHLGRAAGMGALIALAAWLRGVLQDPAAPAPPVVK